MLAAYLKSLRAALRVQFTKKGLRGGKSGVVRLVEDSPVVQVTTCEMIQDPEATPALSYAGTTSMWCIILRMAAAAAAPVHVRTLGSGCTAACCEALVWWRSHL